MPAMCRDIFQGHLPLNQITLSHIQPGLGDLQGLGVHKWDSMKQMKNGISRILQVVSRVMTGPIPGALCPSFVLEKCLFSELQYLSGLAKIMPKSPGRARQCLHSQHRTAWHSTSLPAPVLFTRGDVATEPYLTTI